MRCTCEQITPIFIICFCSHIICISASRISYPSPCNCITTYFIAQWLLYWICNGWNSLGSFNTVTELATPFCHGIRTALPWVSAQSDGKHMLHWTLPSKYLIFIYVNSKSILETVYLYLKQLLVSRGPATINKDRARSAVVIRCDRRRVPLNNTCRVRELVTHLKVLCSSCIVNILMVKTYIVIRWHVLVCQSYIMHIPCGKNQGACFVLCIIM
jgi:hypothetical protein